MKRELKAKLERGEEPDAFRSQVDGKAAVFTGATFAITYLITRLRDFQPYSNYRLPQALDEFEFVVKGVVRLEMMNNPAYRAYRRLFGSVFTRKKNDEKFTWRSRAAVVARASWADVAACLAADPLAAWPGNGTFSPPAELPAGEERWVLWQIHDVVLQDGRRLADVLADFFSGPSETLALVARYDAVPPAQGGAIP